LNFFLQVFCKWGLGLVLALRFVLPLRWALINLPNRYSSLCWRPVTHAQTWASDSTLYRFGRLSATKIVLGVVKSLHMHHRPAV